MIIHGHPVVSMAHLTLDDVLFMRTIPDTMPCERCSGVGYLFAIRDLGDWVAAGLLPCPEPDCHHGRVLSVSLN